MPVGHENQIEELKRYADRASLAHAYLFFGSPHLGKRVVAESLARYVEQGIFEASLPHARPLSDVYILESKNGADIGIDEVRLMRAFLSETPTASPYRTVVICDAELLTPEAQNACLKIAEEPPLKSLLLFIAGDPERLLPTLLSRLRKVHFGAVPVKHIASWLMSQNVPKDEAQHAAELSEGAPGLAYLFTKDERFIKYQGDARDILKAGDVERKDRIKALLLDEDFNFDHFLEALIVVLRAQGVTRPMLWHGIFKLRENANRFNLNPRIQLSALFEGLGG